MSETTPMPPEPTAPDGTVAGDPDRLLKKVIEEANAKAAAITDFKVLANGKVILYFAPSRRELPQYYGSRYCAVDSLIHRYNLKHFFALFQLHDKRRAHQSKPRGSEISESGKWSSIEERAVELCDDILNHDHGYELLARDRSRIYSMLVTLDREHPTLSYATFRAVKQHLLGHYRRLMDEAGSTSDRTRLRQVVRFFTEMEYHDLL